MPPDPALCLDSMPPTGRPALVLVVGGDAMELGDGEPGALIDACRVVRAETEDEALSVLSREPVDVLVAESGDEGRAGLALLTQARRVAPEAVRILFAEAADLGVAAAALSTAAAFRLVPEALTPEGLRAAVKAGVDFRRGAERSNSAPAESERVKRFLDHLLPLLPAGALEIAEDGRVRKANGVAQLLFGPRGREVVGHSAIDAGVPCRQSQCASRTFDAPPCSNREVTTLRTWGHERTLLWSCEAVPAEGGDGSGCAASFLDITERPGLEVKIFHAKHEIEAIFDSVTDPTFLVDAEGRVLRANRALSRHLGKPFREILGRPCSELLGRRQDRCGDCRLADVFATATEVHDEAHFEDGRIYRVHVFPIVKRGRVERAVVRYQDVTAERELEDRLLQSEKMASIGQLSAGIAHEINNPMGFISANLELLVRYVEDLRAFGRDCHGLARSALSGERDPAQAWADLARERADLDVDYLLEDLSQIVGECRDGAERIRDIVSHLKAFSHPSEAEWEEADLLETLEGTLHLVRSELKHRCELVRDYEPLPRVRCLPQALGQVFLNLLVNAAQAIPERGTVTVRARSLGDRVSVEVADTGSGIRPEHLKRIFDPFFTTKPVGKGTGLGLHLALGIVQKHGGELRVASESGGGSTFTILLPVDASPTPE